MTNALPLSAKHFIEPMNHPKRTQEIATILCDLLGGDIELPRMIVSLLKEAETDWSRDWHIHRYRDLYGDNNTYQYSSGKLRCRPDYKGCSLSRCRGQQCRCVVKWRDDFTNEDIVARQVDGVGNILYKETLYKRLSYDNFMQSLKEILEILKKESYPPIGTGNEHFSYMIDLWNELPGRQLIRIPY